MIRRDFLRALAGASFACAASARAQRPVVPVVGILYGASSEEWPNRLAAILKGLADSGYVDGRNVTIDARLFEGRFDRLPEAVNDFVRRPVAVIVATGGPQVALAAANATTTIPVVVTFGGDPVKSGLAASLNRPGGNVTGVTILTVELVAKLLDVFHEILPKATVAGLLVNPDNPVSGAYAKATLDAARARGLQLKVLNAATEQDIDAAFVALAEARAGGLLVAADPVFEIRRGRLIARAERQRIPTFYFTRDFVALGGLASYGASFDEAARTVGVYAGRILRGAKPSELPVLEPSRFELVVNARAAKMLGLAIPPSLLLRADEVIQ